jgi:hypothetical protein
VRYSLDTSALLDGWRRYYPPDVFPGLWSRLDGLIEAGDLRATEEVLFELERKDDDVFAWARERETRLFVPVDAEIQPLVSEILRDFGKLVDTRSHRSAADPFVIALALQHRCTVVTGERPTNRPSRPNIPDVCRGLGIRYLSLLDLVRAESWTFA